LPCSLTSYFDVLMLLVGWLDVDVEIAIQGKLIFQRKNLYEKETNERESLLHWALVAFFR